jgi:hypothetical protein
MKDEGNAITALMLLRHPSRCRLHPFFDGAYDEEMRCDKKRRVGVKGATIGMLDGVAPWSDLV